MGHDVSGLYWPSMHRRYSDTLILVLTLAHSLGQRMDLSSKKYPRLWGIIKDMKLKGFFVKNEENFIAFHYEHE
jgi:hypothetical protein